METRTALSRLAREGVVNRNTLDIAVARLAILRESWFEVLPTERVRNLAEGLPDRHRLRAGDAFQLAAALTWCAERPRHRPFVSFDQRLSDAAEEVGLAVYSLST